MSYGSKGCRCWVEDAGTPAERWMPNAMCPHHGLLADYIQRKDTGAYRVVDLSGHTMDRPVIEQRGSTPDYDPSPESGAGLTGPMPSLHPPAPSEPGRWSAWGEWIPDTVPGADTGAEGPPSPPVTLSAGEVGCRRCGWIARGGDEIYELAVIHAKTHTEENSCRSSANRRGWRNLVNRIRGRKGKPPTS
jgi:hypothetical protein